MAVNINDEYQIRLKKLAEIRKSGINPYPEKFDKQFSVKEILAAEIGSAVKTAGRLLTIRDMGKIAFCHLQDESGKVQLVFKVDELGQDSYKQFSKIFDPGDFIGLSGEVFKTQKGELSVLVKEYVMLSKALRPLPEKWHGLQDQEIKYRQRYLDLISSEETRQRFVFRSELVKALREFYWSKGFSEVETPILVNAASGALAKPFITHHNALDLDVYLRIAPEIFLKECVIGGMEKVFELGRAFRNEGMDPSHLQDFTMCEHYAAYWNYEDNMKFTEEMFGYLLNKLFGTLKITIKNRQGKEVEVDFTAPWPKVSFRDLLLKDCGIDIEKFQDADSLRKEIKAKKIKIDDIDLLGRGNLIDALYKVVSREKLVNPTFLIHHPLDLSPLARSNDANPQIVDRFQLLVNTWEIVNAYSELVDSVDQKQRFEQQSSAKAAGDADAHGKDDEFVKALEHGAPPISGWGMGIDRLATLLTKQDSLRDTVLFPLLKPLNGTSGSGDDSAVLLDLGLNLEQAEKLLAENIKDPITISHCRQSAQIMRGLARHFGADEEQWSIIGLLHDIDWEKTKENPAKHCVLAKEILKQALASDQLIQIIQSHCYGLDLIPEFGSLRRSKKIEYLLAAAETLTGIIIAATLVLPSKKMSDLSLESLKKKFKTAKFAANCNREIIKECELAGIKLDDFLAISLKSLQEIANKLGF